MALLDYAARRPRGVSLVVAHGYSSSKQNLDLMCAFLASHGFNVASIDFPGHKLGASTGRLRTIDDLLEAMLAGVAYARERYGPVIYTVGHSMGATTALRTCAADPALAGAIAIANGYGRPTALLALQSKVAVDLRSGYVDGLTLPEIAIATEAIIDGVLRDLAGRPLLFVAASRDLMVSSASAEELFARAPEPKTFVRVESDHTYAGEAARGALLEWLSALHPREPLPAGT